MVGDRVDFAPDAVLVVIDGIGLAMAIHRWRIARPRRAESGSPPPTVT
jgi:hypothetical protein